MSEEGPITADIKRMTDADRRAMNATRMDAEYLELFIEGLMQRIANEAQAILAAERSAAQVEMRERCANIIAEEIRLREATHDASGNAIDHMRPISELERDIRALPIDGEDRLR